MHFTAPSKSDESHRAASLQISGYFFAIKVLSIWPFYVDQFLSLQHSTLSNSGATITNSASNGSGSGLANQHQVLHVIIIKQKSEFSRLKRHATFHKRIRSKTEKSSNAMFSVSRTTSSALSSERNHLMQIGLSSRTVVPLLD